MLSAAPEGLAPPQLVSIDETTLRVIWTAPQKTNGEITGYNIYLDDVKIETGMKYAGSYTIDDLRPFVRYMVQVRLRSAGVHRLHRPVTNFPGVTLREA